MNHYCIKLFSALLVGMMYCIFFPVHGQNSVPCLIFSGHAEQQCMLDLTKANRIMFEPDGMLVSSSINPETKSHHLLYSLYHHIEIGDGIPDVPLGIDKTGTNVNANLYFVPFLKSLIVEAISESPFKIDIFNINGVLIASSIVSAGQYLPLKGLASGAYVAVATDGNIKLTVKFILK